MAFTLWSYDTGTFQYPLLIGPGGLDGGSAIALNSATIYVGCVFMASVSQSMVGFVVGTGANGGIPTNGLQADLYAVDSNGLPTGASLATATMTPTTTTLNTVTWGTPYTLTAGTCYAIVCKNVAGTPGTNFYRINATSNTGIAQAHNWCGNLLLYSADGGTTWGTGGANLQGSKVGGCRIAPQYSSLGVDAPLMSSGAGFNVGLQLYNTSGSRQARVAHKVRFPIDVLIAGIYVPFGTKTGTPTYNIVGEICSSSASLSTSDTVAKSAETLSTARMALTWSSPYRCLANTDYYIGITPSGATAGDASNRAAIVTALPLTLTPTQGHFLGYYESTASGGPSWSLGATRIGLMDFLIIIPRQGQLSQGMRGGFNG